MKGAGNEWVKVLDLRGRMDWEWIETYPEQVYFATRQDSQRAGDIVTMWTRVEYKYPQSPLDHKSTVSRDDWDCKKKQRSTAGLVFYQWNNLQDDSPERSTNRCATGEDPARHDRRDAAQLCVQHPAGHAGHPGTEKR